MIQLHNISLRRGTKQLLEDASANLYSGEKIGLIGANGSGKSSVFALLRGDLEIDLGELDVNKSLRIASVAQETPALSQSAIEFVIDGDQRLRETQRQLTKAEADDNADKIAQYHSLLHDLDGYSAHARAAQLLAGLGFTNEQGDQSVASFSGGWRMRLNLAQALMSPSDLLLLDEPTNHLDLDAIIWLENWLKSYPGMLMLISHDRDFIDATVERILHIEQQSIYSYSGNYSEFERQRAEKMILQQKAYEKQSHQIAHMQKFVDRFHAKASKAKQAQSRVKALERMVKLEAAHQDSQFTFHFRTADHLPNPLINLEQCNLGYDDHLVLKNINLSILAKSRIGLLGPNGAGKSTLIKALAQKLLPLTGEVIPSRKLNIGYFDQHQVDALDLDLSPLAILQKADKQADALSLRKHLGSFHFSNDMALAPIQNFSGGEKARVALVLLVWQKPNLLLLDEPTNHLDLEMRRALSLALQEYQGAMILVSHDRYLLATTCDEFMLIANGSAENFSGDLHDYQSWLFEHRKQLAGIRGEQKKTMAKKNSKQHKPLQKAITKIERQIDKLQVELATVEQRLGDESLYTNENKIQLADVLAQQKKLHQQQIELEQQWLSLMEEIES